MKFFLHLIILCGIFLLSLVTGCQSTKTDVLPDFSNIVWQSKTHPGLKFKFDGKQRWAGHTGRQRFIGPVELKPCHEVYEVEFGPVMMTRTNNKPTHPEDTAFLKMLGKTKYINHQDGALTFNDKNGEELLRAIPDNPTLP